MRKDNSAVKPDSPGEEKITATAPDPSIALNGAANLILSMLSEPVRETLRETAATTLTIPLWQLIAGLVQQAYDVGLFTTPALDPDWLRYMSSKPAVFNQARCEYCGEVFQPRWPKQKFCSQETGQEKNCGTAYQLNLARDRVSGHVVGGKYPLGQEPRHAPSSALRPAEADEAPVVAGDKTGVEGAAGLG